MAWQGSVPAAFNAICRRSLILHRFFKTFLLSGVYCIDFAQIYAIDAALCKTS